MNLGQENKSIRLEKKKIILIFALTNLFLGLLVYVLLDRNTILFKFFNFSASTNFFSFNQLRNYLSDFFYMFFICSICHFYHLIKIQKVYIILLLLSPVLHESLQFFFISLGTFDLFDLIVYFSVTSIYYLLIYKYIEKTY
jgi:hypothetical protein